MTTVGLEEHFVTSEVLDAWRTHGGEGAEGQAGTEIGRRLAEVGEDRLAAMDDAGLDVQVLSLTSPGLQSLPAREAVALARATNDAIAGHAAAHPDRIQGFATLPTPDPQASAEELQRAVSELGLHGAMLFGRTGERNLDDAATTPIFEAAAALRAPLYIHPQVPQDPVRRAYYSGFGEEIDDAFSRFGFGWHLESGIQFLRLALAGVFDRFPDLQIILGHWGEVVLFYLDRSDGLAAAAGLPRRFSEYARTNLFVTPGGVWSERYARWTLDVVGIDRIMFATDYPYRPGPDGGAAAFLERAGLDPAQRDQVASGNWSELVAGIRR